MGAPPSFRNAATWGGNSSIPEHPTPRIEPVSAPVSLRGPETTEHSFHSIEEVAASTTAHSIKPAPGHGESARFQRRVGHETIHSISGNIKTTYPYIVIGIFDGAERWPKERVIIVRHPSLLIFYIWWGMVRLRGIYYVFSLKGVRGVRLYKYNWASKTDEHIQLNKDEMETIRVFHQAYKTWSLSKNKDWTTWVQESLNNRKLRHGVGPPSKATCLEMVLDWSATRISIVILVPVLLSLVVGFWFQSRDPNDITTIQTAWTISSYIVSSGGLMAALLAILSGISDN